MIVPAILRLLVGLVVMAGGCIVLYSLLEIDLIGIANKTGILALLIYLVCSVVAGITLVIETFKRLKS